MGAMSIVFSLKIERVKKKKQLLEHSYIATLNQATSGEAHRYSS